MTPSLGVMDYLVICMMLAISASVGVYFRFTGGRQKTAHEFLMAGKNMSIWPVSFSLMATYMSAITILGLPSETYNYGSQICMMFVGVPIGGVIVAYLFLPVYFRLQVSTSYEYLEKRFGKPTRSTVSVLFILQMVLYMAVVLYAPSLALNSVTGLSTWASAVAMAVVCTFYCSLGGLKAVLWTDVFQSVLMYITVISIIVKGTIDVGGFAKAMQIANDGGRLIFFETSLDATMRYTFFNCVTTGLVFGLYTFGANQTQIQRMMSVKSLKEAQRALLISCPLICIFMIFCVWDGVTVYSLFHDCDPIMDPGDSPLASTDQLVPYAALKLFRHIPGFTGLCVVGVFSASLSTISTAVNSLTAVTVEDFMRPYCLCKGITESRATFIAKIIAILYGGLCLLLTYVIANFRGVLEASHILFGMVAGPVLGLFSVGMLTTTANQEGAFIGLLSGFTLNAWMAFGSYSSDLKIPHLPRFIDGCPMVTNSSVIEYYELFKQNTTSSDYFRNNVSIFKTETLNLTFTEDYSTNENIFPLYTVSFMWFAAISALTTFVVGYIASYAIGLLKEKQPVDPETLSPMIKKWILKSDTEGSKKASRSKLQEMKSNSGCKTEEGFKVHADVPQNATSRHAQAHL